MKLLITGITGFVGSHLAEYLLQVNPDNVVFGTKRWRSPQDNIKQIIDQLELYNCDLRDLSSLIMVLEEIRPDIIFHLAAQSFVTTSYLAPVDTVETNVIGTINLLEAVRLLKIDPVLHVCSSSEVYGQVTEEDVPINEDCPLRPVSPYAVSKVGEDMAAFMYYQAYGLRTIRTRMFTHTGPRRGDVFVVSFFAKQIAQIEKDKQEAVLRVGNLDSIRTFSDVRDAVRAYWLLVNKCKPGEVYNIGGNVTLTIREMLDMLLSYSDYPGEISIEVDQSLLRPADVTLQIPDITKFQKETGWQPEIPFDQTLQDTLNYWRKNV